MYVIKNDYLIGKDFYVGTITQVIYTCIGYGQTENGRLLLVGTFFNAQDNTTIVRTFMDKEITFLGK